MINNRIFHAYLKKKKLDQRQVVDRLDMQNSFK